MAIAKHIKNKKILAQPKFSAIILPITGLIAEKIANELPTEE
ncbi:MAG: hypothetical protein RCG15_07390 [Candidatus Rickettsia vulgarisii]